ncbi:hypothetical protein Pla144_30250 [Bythopirellula polymerisocia]|uniref:Uncharacterized protein n=1 Tax=Bythopirellula polymerisocia TaxID=2528003 RepID=A0A5C6CLP4_9BACT|nr:hypothetical protein Pla144_30250 [Bythopirellula polymerisocia]
MNLPTGRLWSPRFSCAIHNWIGPNGTVLIPHTTLVNFYAGALAQCGEFLLKRHAMMILLLLLDTVAENHILNCTSGAAR